MLRNTDIENLHQRIATTIAQAQKTSFVAVNTAMIRLYWEIGRMIVEQEQAGESRANYGEFLIAALAKRLKIEFGKGYSAANLRNFRQFYMQYPIHYALRSELTWTHYRLLMRVENLNARAFYEDEAVRGMWTTRALERQMNTLYYERLLASNDRLGIQEEASAKIQELPVSPLDFVKDPYVLEFLGVKADSSLYENDLEQLIIDNLQGFLLELGRGFSFVARQQLIRADHETFYSDHRNRLVFREKRSSRQILNTERAPTHFRFKILAVSTFRNRTQSRIRARTLGG